MTQNAELRRRTIQSLFWQFLGVGGQRIVTIASYSVLARLISKPDIGLFGVVLAGIGAIEALTKFFGDETTIWSERSDERQYLDTVFTVHAVRGTLITALLCAAAPALAWFFTDAEAGQRYWVPGLFLVLAANGLVEGLGSPARAIKLKGMAFRRIAFGDFCAVLLGAGLTITLAWWRRDVWALLFGFLGTTALRSTVSYFVAPHLPRLRFDRDVARELFHYGRGAAGTPFLLLMIFSAPAFVLFHIAGAAAVAVYDFAGKLAKLPEDIFLRVLAPVAIPAYAQLKGDTERLGRAWLGAVHAFLLVGAPLSLTLAWCGNALPALVFGESYGEIGGLFALLALHGGLAGLTSVVGPLFWAVGQPQWDRKAQFFRCLAIYSLGVPAAYYAGALGFAAAACVGITVALWFSVSHALPLLGLRLGDLAHAARDGTALGLVLGVALVAIDLLFAPTGAVRVLTAGGVGGPIVLLLALRVLRSRNRTEAVPVAPPPLADADV